MILMKGTLLAASVLAWSGSVSVDIPLRDGVEAPAKLESAAPAASFGCPGETLGDSLLHQVLGRWSAEKGWSHEKTCMTYAVAAEVLAGPSRPEDLLPFLDMKTTLLLSWHIRVNLYGVALMYRIAGQDIPYPYECPIVFERVVENDEDPGTRRPIKKVYYKTKNRLLTIFPWTGGREGVSDFRLVYTPPFVYRLMEDKDIADGLRAALEVLKRRAWPKP